MLPWYRWFALSPRRVLVIGCLVGMLIGVTVVTAWSRADRGYTVDILGSGDSISVLITHEHRKVLIVSGNDGAEFSNAFASVVARLNDDLEIVLLDPSASIDVTERASALDVDLLLRLPDESTAVDPTITGSLTVSFLPTAELHVTVVPGSGWYGTLTSGNATLVISNGSVPIEELPPSAVLIVLGDASSIDLDHFSTVIASSRSDTSSTHAVRPGESITISLDGNQIRLPKP